MIFEMLIKYHRGSALFFNDMKNTKTSHPFR